MKNLPGPAIILSFCLMGCGAGESVEKVINPPRMIGATTAQEQADKESISAQHKSITLATLGPKAEPSPPTDLPGVHNLMMVSDRILSGSEPHGEEAFESLKHLGVKTIISVDGAKPQVDLARKHGIRYLHIPIGYDGISEEAGLSLARAVNDAPSPIYVHCHHGKHRGPAAAAVACIASGDVNSKDALQILQRAGTSKDYKGLWRDVEAYVPPPTGTELPALVEVAEVGSFAAAMAQVDRAFDNLKLLREAKWKALPDQPDLAPAQEALLLQEGLHEAGRNVGDGYDEQFKTWIAEAEKKATELRRDLKARDSAAADKHMLGIEQSCKQCHQSYRD
jgi:protein tyrosine phosphatase (PTP) superfamily phosphohydrolase (DUF442 family)/cytochrome c556